MYITHICVYSIYISQYNAHITYVYLHFKGLFRST